MRIIRFSKLRGVFEHPQHPVDPPLRVLTRGCFSGVFERGLTRVCGSAVNETFTVSYMCDATVTFYGVFNRYNIIVSDFWWINVQNSHCQTSRLPVNFLEGGREQTVKRETLVALAVSFGRFLAPVTTAWAGHRPVYADLHLHLSLLCRQVYMDSICRLLS